jgi:hypothetical protein
MASSITLFVFTACSAMEWTARSRISRSRLSKRCRPRTYVPQPPACKVADRYVNQEGRPIVSDTHAPVRSRVQCGTSAGHMSPGTEPEAIERAADLRFLSWGGQDLNLRPTDYEFDPALSPTRKIELRESLTSGFSPQSSPSLCNVSQSVAGPMRDTSCAGLAEPRESELLCIRTSERVRPNRAFRPRHRGPTDPGPRLGGVAAHLPQATWGRRVPLRPAR